MFTPKTASLLGVIPYEESLNTMADKATVSIISARTIKAKFI